MTKHAPPTARASARANQPAKQHYQKVGILSKAAALYRSPFTVVFHILSSFSFAGLAIVFLSVGYCFIVL